MKVYCGPLRGNLKFGEFYRVRVLRVDVNSICSEVIKKRNDRDQIRILTHKDLIGGFFTKNFYGLEVHEGVKIEVRFGLVLTPPGVPVPSLPFPLSLNTYHTKRTFGTQKNSSP